MTRNEILDIMKERVLILDGATGTYLQRLGLTEDDFRGSRLADHPTPLKGCNDVLCLTQPHIIERMHRDYLEAGADIIETNSFNCNRFSLADYGLEDRVYEISRAAAECAVRAINSSLLTPHSSLTKAPCALVAGSMGPTNRTASMSADVNDPGKREVTFQQLYETYSEQARGLIDGGADVLQVETVFDTLNAKAAIKAITDLAAERGTDIPIMVSATLSDASGRTLSGQTVEAFAASVAHANPIAIGLNCGFGARQLLPWLERLSAAAPCPVSVHPNAGLPNVMGEYDETPESFALHAAPSNSHRGRRNAAHTGSTTNAAFNIYGGCCGTTPAHIKALAEALQGVKPRPLPHPTGITPTTLSGLEPLTLPIAGNAFEGAETPFINVGERTNVAGSAKFKRLIKERRYDEALTVAREQVENGAQVIDICMDDGLIDGVEAMTTFLNLIAAEPEIARVPVMIDSSKWDILKAGLECVQGKSIVNSISLKEGEEAFVSKARHIHAMGAAAVVMLFDEDGQADTYERKVSVARRAYNLLKNNGFPTEDIIFDPNVLAVATGMAEHDDYARAFIEACRTIRDEMPEVHLSGGISNLSFSFRGNNVVRQAMHSVFLHHAMEAGLDMSIVNPAMTTDYNDIPEDLLRAVEDVILNSDSGAAERLLESAPLLLPPAGGETGASTASRSNNRGNSNTPTLPLSGGDGEGLHYRITHAMLKGITDTIDADTEEAYRTEGSALGVIDHYLMPAMEEVGRRFAEGKMFLPQVVKAARVMKQAVAKLPFNSSLLTPHSSLENGVVLMATVKGDVHDIGKNIVGVVTQCNGYEVNDLGVMTEPETIVSEARRTGAAVIGLSGLITPSLEEMIRVLRMLRENGMTTPVIVGGATTSALHTAVKMAPEYPDGVVIHANAAADNPAIIRRLLADDSAEYIAAVREEQRAIREDYARSETEKRPPLTIDEARRRRHVKSADEVAVPTEEAMRPIRYDSHSPLHPNGGCTCCDPLLPLINWQFFFCAWGLKGRFPELLDDPEKGNEAQKLYRDAQRMLSEIIGKRLLRLQTYAQIVPAWSDDSDRIHVIDGEGREHQLPMPRSLRDEEETKCLADHVSPLQLPPAGGESDYLCPFVVSAGVGVRALQDKYRAEGDEYRAIMVKLLADRLTEAMAEKLSADLRDRLHWGRDNIRMAFGYGACPDHTLKREVFDILGVGEESGLTLTDTCMINPGESICGLIFANTPTKYFTV